MARNKDEIIAIRVQASLRTSFEDALAKTPDFASTTAFFEDAMRALILSVRQKKDLAVPLEFLEKEKSGK